MALLKLSGRNENLNLRSMDKGSDAAKKVVVAVKASKEIPRTAIVWALTHVVQPGDCITLLVVVVAHSSGRKFWGFPRFSGDCAHSHPKSRLKSIELRTYLNNSCSQMMLQLNDVYDADKINVEVKIVPGSPCGIVAAESKRARASWVVLDKRLKHEEKHCMENLQCNVVAVKRSKPKVLRLVLAGSSESDPQMGLYLPIRQDVVRKPLKDVVQSENSTEEPAVTPSSSPEVGTSFTCTEAGASSVSSSDPGTSSPFSASEIDGAVRKEMPVQARNCQNLETISSDSDNEQLGPLTNLKSQQLVAEILNSRCTSSQQIEEISRRFANKANVSSIKKFQGMFFKHGKPGSDHLNYRPEMDLNGSVREAVALSRNAPQGPPLCSICRHKAPVFGKPPRWFSYAELELATGGFSKANFLAEGGFGSVHRGVLADGQAVAVKQHKLASSQGDQEFCSEVEVLSCAQHRNVVMLIGFCVEVGKRLLVYEFICNGSLDSHLYGCNREPLEWAARHKIAVGAARGLRYLHEECRVGCIVHRDMRPNNILITHDYEPQVGDFGLARWQPHGDLGVDTRVIGTFGYLAPEYAQSGQITEKADVYSFGVVLVELITGRKAVDMNRPKGEQCLTEWARRLLEKCAVDELVDRRLRNNYSEPEVYSMMHAASMCIRHDSNSRPRMSHVLRILEGDHAVGLSSPSMPSQEIGSRSNRILGGRQQKHELHSCPTRSMASVGVEGRAPCGVVKTNY